MNTDAFIDVLLRWGHTISGIIWIGHLYFFNLVNVPTQGKLDAETKKKVNPELLPRALFWFRWGAMFTLIFGLLLFWWNYMRGTGGYMRDLDGGLSARALTIMIGMTLALIMWFNVWFVIWPAQKRIIGGLKSGNPAPPELPKRALLFSRINTFLSGPMLFLMFMAPHYSAIDFPSMALAFGIGFGTIFVLIKMSPKVGTTI